MILSTFSTFYFATVAILLGWFSVSTPFFILILICKKIYLKQRALFLSEIDLSDLNREEVESLLKELSNFLQSDNDFENLKLASRLEKEFAERKISVRVLLESIDIFLYTVTKGDVDPYPERGSIVVFSDSDEEDRIFFKIKQPEKFWVKVQRILFT